MALCDESGKLCSTPLLKGAPAPYDGQLLNESLSLNLGIRAEGCNEKVMLAERRMQSLIHIKVREQLDLREADRALLEGKIKLLEESLEEAVNKANVWYKDPVGIALLTATAIGSGVLAVYMFTK